VDVNDLASIKGDYLSLIIILEILRICTIFYYFFELEFLLLFFIVLNASFTSDIYASTISV
jgi:hypothetical protein